MVLHHRRLPPDPIADVLALNAAYVGFHYPVSRPPCCKPPTTWGGRCSPIPSTSDTTFNGCGTWAWTASSQTIPIASEPGTAQVVWQEDDLPRHCPAIRHVPYALKTHGVSPRPAARPRCSATICRSSGVFDQDIPHRHISSITPVSRPVGAAARDHPLRTAGRTRARSLRPNCSGSSAPPVRTEPTRPRRLPAMPYPLNGVAEWR